MRVRSTISLSPKQFQWARKQMSANEWDRAGDDEGISRYVQELIKKDMPKDWQPPKGTSSNPSPRLSPSKVEPVGSVELQTTAGNKASKTRRLATRKRS